MSVADEWRNLATDFERLDPQGNLVVTWRYFPATRAHTFSTFNDKDGNLIEAKFRAFCAKSGELAGMTDPFFDWLIQVKLQSHNDLPDYGIHVSPITGAESGYNSGRIEKPTEACAALCYRFEAYERSKQTTAMPIVPLLSVRLDAGTHVQDLQASGAVRAIVTKAETAPTRRRRTSSMIESPVAVKKLEQHLTLIKNKGITLTRFVGDAGISERTLRSVIATNKGRPDTFQGIAKAMNVRYEDLLHE